MLYIAEIVIHTDNYQGDVTFKIFKNREKAKEFLQNEFEHHLFKIKNCSNYNLKDHHESNKDSFFYYSYIEWETTYDCIKNHTLIDHFDLKSYREEDIIE